MGGGIALSEGGCEVIIFAKHECHGTSYFVIHLGFSRVIGPTINCSIKVLKRPTVQKLR